MTTAGASHLHKAKTKVVPEKILGELQKSGSVSWSN